jgi:hypothetical protein
MSSGSVAGSASPKMFSFSQYIHTTLLLQCSVALRGSFQNSRNKSKVRAPRWSRRINDTDHLRVSLINCMVLPLMNRVNVAVSMTPDRTAIVRHIVDCTAVSCSITAIYAVIETFVLHLSPGVSIRARLLIVALSFLGLGSLFSRLRDMSLAHTGTLGTSSESLKLAHDVLFTMASNIVLAPAVYSIVGATLDQALAGTAVTIAVSTLTGPINGLLIDRFRSWAGLPNSGRFAVEARNHRSIFRIVATVITIIVFVVCIYAHQHVI